MKVTVWNENVHEKEMPRVTELYPGGLHGYIKSFLECDDIEVRTAVMEEEQNGLPEEVLADTDVLIWWGHAAHNKVDDETVDRVQKHILAGMGLIVLHSGHHSKIFRRMMGTSCNLKWRDGDRERVWIVNPNHPIAEGVEDGFELVEEEMYGEAFDIPNPEDVIFMGWFQGGEVFRSGCTWRRGNGKIFYFQPGHETNPSFQNANVQRIIKNAVNWACPTKERKPIPVVHFESLENK